MTHYLCFGITALIGTASGSGLAFMGTCRDAINGVSTAEDLQRLSLFFCRSFFGLGIKFLEMCILPLYTALRVIILGLSGGKIIMDKPNNDYIATQTEEGFQIVFHDSVRKPINVKFDELQSFIKKINERAIAEKTLTLTNEEEVLIRLWQMLLIPEGVKH